MNVLEINKDIIPYTFDILIGRELFNMRIDYNNTADLFTVTLTKNGTDLCVSEPIIYGMPLFGDLLTRGDFPDEIITPVDESGETCAVTFDNLSSTVLLSVTGGDFVE